MEKLIDPLLNGLHIAILVIDGFEQDWFDESKNALEREGAITKIVSGRRGKVQGASRKTGAGHIDVDLAFDEADPEDFDAVVLPGKAVEAGKIRSNSEAQQFMQGAEKEGKPVVASDANDDIAAFTEKMIEVIAAKMRAELRGTADEHATGIASS